MKSDDSTIDLALLIFPTTFFIRLSLLSLRTNFNAEEPPTDKPSLDARRSGWREGPQSTYVFRWERPPAVTAVECPLSGPLPKDEIDPLQTFDECSLLGPMNERLGQERFPTRAAIGALAEKFSLPNDDCMQDWEYEVADPARIDEFLAYAESGPDEDEAFVLMMMIFQSFEELGKTALQDKRWARVEMLLHNQFEVHQSTLRYWASSDADPEDDWHIAPLVRSVIGSHSEKLGSLP